MSQASFSGLCVRLLFLFLLAVRALGIQRIPLASQARSNTVSGSVNVLDKSTLEIENFSFDGTDLEAYFFVGQWGEPGSKYGMRVDYPYGNSSSPPLGNINNQTLPLKMPEGVRTWDLRWISVWSTRFRTDYGHAYIGRGISYALPPTTTEPPLFSIEYLYENEPEEEHGLGCRAYLSPFTSLSGVLLLASSVVG